MKNKKIIFFILLFLMTFSIGYALFSGNVNITSTAKVDPVDLNISTTCGVIELSDSLNENNYFTTASGTESPVISCSGTDVQWSSNYSLPGASQGYWIEVKNNSNFPISLKHVEISGNAEASEEASNNIMATYLLYGKPRNEIDKSKDLLDFKILNEDISSNSCLTNKCYVDANGTFSILIKEYLRDNYTGNNLNLNINRTIKMQFEQVN